MSENASLTRRQLYSAIGSVKDYAPGYQEKFLNFLSLNLYNYVNISCAVRFFGDINNRVFLSRNYRLIVAPRKFDDLKTNI